MLLNNKLIDDPTRERIRRTAVTMFAAKGIDAVTTRAIAEKAEVNTAAINYHFGNKANLTVEVFQDVARRTAQRRLRNLKRAGEDAAGRGEVVPTRVIVETFIDAYINDDDPMTGVLLARLVLKHRLEPNDWTKRVVREEIDDMARRYIEAFARALPDLDTETIHWRYHIMMGAIQVMMSDTGPGSRIARLSDGLCDPSDRHVLRVQLIDFIVNAFDGEAASRGEATRSPT